MSRLRLTNIAAPVARAATKVELYFDSTGIGTPATPQLIAQDSGGNKQVVCPVGATLTYRLVSIRTLTASTSYVPTAGTRALYVECVGGGGQGGGAATSSSTVSLGGGGGGGAYAAKWLTGAAVKNPTTYAVGAGGTGGTAGNAGNAGGDTTWDTNVIVAKGGSGGAVLAAGSTAVLQAGAAGGLAASCTGDLCVGGLTGGAGYRLSGTTYLYAGTGASGVAGGDGGVGAINSAVGATGAAGLAYGTGGAGAATLATAAAGGVGFQGFIRVWEFA
jgi:hypothetical protein